jgi:UDP-GlcNAc:undecaprenyl-phosphate/decaprenyl-phosphate GlcNAc-1-phosphate transferase
MIAIHLAVFIGSLLLSVFFTWYVRGLALARGWVAAPTSGRHIHQVPLPRLGGVAIFFSFVTIIAALVLVSSLLRINIDLSAHTVFNLVLCGAIVFLLGLYDDIRPLKPYIKLVVQSLAAMLLFFEGFRIFQLPLIFGGHQFGWIALPLTIIWVLWITNAFNLIDGLDGLAAGSALFSTLTVFVVSLVGGTSLVSLLTVGLAGAILGFLRFNFNPATIFLGDCGSLFIGFMLSALALAGSQKTPTMVAVAIPVVSFGLPILETLFSLIRRWLNGQPLFSADREHIHHKLLERGFSHRQVVIILYGVSAVCGLLSIFLLYPGGGTIAIVLFVLGAGIWIGVQHLGYHEISELGRVAHRTFEQKKIIINNLAVRRATRALLKVKNIEEVQEVLQDAFQESDFDGYRLCSAPMQWGHLGHVNGDCHANSQSNEYCLDWRKTSKNGESAEAAAPHWAVTLDLITTKQERRGFFSIYRLYNGRPLLADINILASGFQLSLADAIDRVINENESHEVEETEAPSPALI